MEQEIQPPKPESAGEFRSLNEQEWPEQPVAVQDEAEMSGLKRVFIGRQGLRAGWSVVLFVILTAMILIPLGSAASAFIKNVLHEKPGAFTAYTASIGEAASVLAILGAGALMALMERRRLTDYNLAGPRRLAYFGQGLVAGFVALSVLVGLMTLGGWAHVGPVTLHGGQIAGFGALWGTAFLLTGLFEEGSFRCYLQSTLTRGIHFWAALSVVAVLCGLVMLRDKSNGAWGVYAFALLGLVPCWQLHQKKAEGAGFWQAAWVTSTTFGFVHTGNHGETWIGIFAAATIGFVFCVSIRVTGSAWWAIGCHAAWDWAETYFYGTADSGFVAQGHLLSTSPTGSVLWSGGTDGPEGSLLVLPVVLLLLVALLVMYGRRKAPDAEPAAMESTAG